MSTKSKVEEIEGKLPVENLKVHAFGKAFQIYPWLKGRLFSKIITGSETRNQKGPGLYLKQLGSFFYGLHNIFGRYDIWAFSTSIERREINGSYYDKLFDFIGNECGYKLLLIELRVFSYYPYRKVASKHAISKSFFILFEEVYSRVFIRKKQPTDQELTQKLFDEMGVTVNSAEVIRKYLAQYRLMKFWLKVLPNPKLVMMSVAYTNYGYIAAFKEKGIQVVEMQHGVISKNHQAYYYKKQFSSNQFPDLLLTTGQRVNKVFDEENEVPIQETIAVGSYVIDHFASKRNTKKSGDQIKLLFTLQDGIMTEKLIRFIVALRDVLPAKYEITIQPRRTSVNNLRSLYPELKDICFSESDFYSTVINMDVHCTIYSTTAIEALSLGVPNILINIDNQSVEQLGEYLAGNAYTLTVNSVDEFISAAEKLHKSDEAKVKVSNSANIALNYKENIKAVLKKLLR